MTRDAFFGSLAFFAFVAWMLVEFLNLIFWMRKLLNRLGMWMDEAPSSVDSTVAMMDEWPYAAQRNASQHRKNGGSG
jgi:hypothetical protein